MPTRTTSWSTSSPRSCPTTRRPGSAGASAVSSAGFLGACSKAALREDAGRAVAAAFAGEAPQFGVRLLARLDRDRAPRMEAAAGRDLDRIRRLPAQDLHVRAMPRIAT